ncbi:MAG: HTH domain-containing protein [Proteobacteria bacterium]|uniref:HTH domain-containing protein n=1 Tax=Candidatus Fonsibacter lacus TaxID=2576439 RepID=A0A964UZZ6_9PROT|nr:HTH domain-containing protein [Candidatus Fonsibacter lacus]NCU72690.1 HTH domain-containing protein [Candidatus Fonsibacter lacus]
MSLQRAIDLIVALRRHPEGLTTAQLSEALGVCSRTVRRYLSAWQMAGWVEAELGECGVKIWRVV